MRTSRLISNPRGGLVTGSLALVSSVLLAAAAQAGFIENRGQVDAQARFYGGGEGAAIWLTPEAIVIDLMRPGSHAGTAPADPREWQHQPRGREAARSGEGWAVRLPFAGARRPDAISSSEPLPGRYNFYRGNQPSKWQEGVQAFAQVTYRELWPGTDLVLRLEDGGIAYEFYCRPGVAPPAEPFRFEGAEEAEISDQARWASTPLGSIVDRRLEGGFGGMIRVGMAAEDRMRGGLLPSDPSTLVWSTYLGGAEYDEAFSVDLLPSGQIILTGLTYSADLPVTTGAHDLSYNGLEDVFAACLTPGSPSIVFCTYLGGSSADFSASILNHATDLFLIAGGTSSPDFPVTAEVLDATLGGTSDGFVTELHTTNGTLQWSTYIGGGSSDSVRDIDVFPSTGDIGLAMVTRSSDFPLSGDAFDTTYGGNADAAVAIITSLGRSLVYGTYLGGSGSESCDQITASGNRLFVSGFTGGGFPVTPGAYDTTPNGFDCYVAAFKPGSGYDWGTYLGAGGGTNLTEYPLGLTTDGLGNPVLCGWTTDPGFPTTAGSYDTSFNGVDDCFVARLSRDGTTLMNSTFVGGQDADDAIAVSIDADGRVFVAGLTRSADFPVTADGYDTTIDNQDAFLFVLSPQWNSLEWSTVLGGSSSEAGFALEIDPAGQQAVIVGSTDSGDFPVTPNVPQSAIEGPTDAFVSVLAPNLVPASVVDASDPSLSLHLAASSPAIGSTLIRYRTPWAGPLEITAFDIAGRQMATIARESAAARRGSIRWDLRDSAGRRVPSGVYFLRMRAAGLEAVQRVVVGR